MAASRLLRDRARVLRSKETDAERLLWRRLRARQLDGVKFRRQYPISPYIVDFCAPERGLIIELDGGQHAEQALADERRSQILAGRGFRVLRFWDTEVLNETDGVLERIMEEIGPKR